MTIRNISLFGMPEEIGFQHGQLLAEQIHHNIGFYKSLFLKTIGDESQILNVAKDFKANIQAFNPNYILEIDHIAKGASVSEPLWLYAINARTELSMMKGAGECTAIVCPSRNILAQTWDWAKKLEGNFFIMEITFPDGHKILQLSEAGIIGKIGLNNRGIGVSLNYLYDENTHQFTVPIHILLRQVLESRTLEDAKKAARKSCNGKASNLIIAGSSKAVDIEFAGNLINFFDIQEDGYVHTNHFLHAKPPLLLFEESFINSVTRRNSALKILNYCSTLDAQKFIEILSDQSNGKNAILANYKPDPQELLGDYGTLATIVMDLDNQVMLVRDGNPSYTNFSMSRFHEYRLN